MHAVWMERRLEEHLDRNQLGDVAFKMRLTVNGRWCRRRNCILVLRSEVKRLKYRDDIWKKTWYGWLAVCVQDRRWKVTEIRTTRQRQRNKTHSNINKKELAKKPSGGGYASMDWSPKQGYWSAGWFYIGLDREETGKDKALHHPWLQCSSSGWIWVLIVREWEKVNKTSGAELEILLVHSPRGKTWHAWMPVWRGN